MYNPFTPFTESIFKETLGNGFYYFIIQRFEWPLVEKGKGFMVTPFSEEEAAQLHASDLGHNEGKLLDARYDIDKIQGLLSKGSGYRLFLNKFREDNWKARMLRLYKDKIISYLRSRTPFTRNDSIDIHFSLESGRFIAKISNGKTAIKVKGIDLIM